MCGQWGDMPVIADPCEIAPVGASAQSEGVGQMGSNMANTRSEFCVRRATSVDLSAAEDLVASYQKRMTTTVMGAWEEEPLPRVATTGEAAPVLAVDPVGDGGRRRQRHLVGHAPLNGAA